MKKFPMTVPFSIDVLQSHAEIKSKLLSEINSTKKFVLLKDECDKTNISKCDWNNSRDTDRIWLKIFEPYLMDYLTVWRKELGYNWFNVVDIWFQQYECESEHDWHLHGNNYTGVYFLDLPEDSPKTLFKDPMDSKIEKEFDISEGDILIFPSFIIHKSPKNNTIKTKTIISWNIDLMGKWIEN
jgi:hypothetical protein